jgi:1,4-dihydroxy-6-naphthoate synthase
VASKESFVTADRPVVRAACSPDADDAFMFYGFACGAVEPEGFELQREMQDIESLNRRALAGDLEVTAISYAAWPRLAEHYDIGRVGSSFGIGYGPKLVAREAAAPEDLLDGEVAVPGELTSAALTLRMMLPGVKTRAMAFDIIPEAVLSGEVRSGVVIHESQLTYQAEGLVLVRDLGEWWSDETGGLPLPLGANAISRRLDAGTVDRFEEAFRRSIAHAREHRGPALEYALQFGRGLDQETGGEFVGLYVNELTLDPGEKGRQAVREFYTRAAAAGLLPGIEPRWASDSARD